MNWRIYPKAFMSNPGNPSTPGLGGVRLEGNSMPSFYNIEMDPREENNLLAQEGWIVGPYIKLIGAYMKSLDKYPNPPPVNLTEFAK